jgi:hypothetical protein
MSDEQKKLEKWRTLVPATLFTVAMLVAYQATHYATATVFYTPLGSVCMHSIAGHAVPSWVDDYFFWPAKRFDKLTGLR